jgi:hypothetical protein
MVRGLCVLVLVLACSASAAEARVTVSAVKDPVRQVQAGARLRVEYVVRNTGTAATARVALVRGRTVIALTNGRVSRFRRSKALAVRAVVPARTAAGAYRVRVCVGSSCRQSRRTVTVTAPVLPAPAPAPPTPAPAPAPIPAPVSPDTTPPQPPALSVRDLESAAMTGSTLHYRAGGNGAFTVTADVDAEVTRVEFGSLSPGWFGGGSDPAPPFRASYGFSLLSAGPSGPVTAVAFDAAGNASAPARLSVVGDGAGPTVILTCEPDDCTGQISLSAADGGSGVARLLYSLDGSEPTAQYEIPFLAPTEMPLRARAVDRVGNVGPELARNIGPPPADFAFTFGPENVNAAGDDDAQTAWLRPGVAGSLRVTAGELVDFSVPSAFEWPQGTGWTVEPAFDTAVYSFAAGATPPSTVTVHATTNQGPRQSFFRLRPDGTAPAAPAIACACDQHSTVGVEIALTATDADSGVDRILYSLDGAEPSILYSGPFKAYTGSMLRTRAIDRVGNAGLIATRALDIDVSGDPSPPTALILRFTSLQGIEERDGTLHVTSPGSPQSFTLQATAEDAESGIAAIAYPEIPGWTPSSVPNGVVYERAPSSEESGPHVVRVTNHAGRVSEASFRIASG